MPTRRTSAKNKVFNLDMHCIRWDKRKVLRVQARN